MKTTPYHCSTCGHPYRHKSNSDKKPIRRWILECVSKVCKRRKRAFYPQSRPLSGDYR